MTNRDEKEEKPGEDDAQPEEPEEDKNETVSYQAIEEANAIAANDLSTQIQFVKNRNKGKNSGDDTDDR